MKKGFTLIEILAVVTIIGLIFILVIPRITTSLKNKKGDVDKTTENLVLSATKLYVSEHSSKFEKEDGNISCMPLHQLVRKGYLDGPVKNVTDDKDITNGKSVRITYDKGFKYELVDSGECKVYYCNSDYCDNDGNGYTEVDYIETTGEQYIDTEYVFKNKPKVIGEIMINSASDMDIMGNNNARAGCFIINYENLNFYYRYSETSYTLFKTNTSIKIWHNFEFSDKLIIDGIEKGSVSSYDFSSNTQNFLIGKARNKYSFARFKRIIIYDGDEIVRDLIPVYRENDNKSGMFDTVNKKFYTSKTDKDFYYEINNKEKELPNKDSELEYIESTGEQYIDTGYVFRNKPKVIGEIMITSSTNMDIMGNNNLRAGCFIINYENLNFYYRYSDASYTLFRTNTSIKTWHNFEFSDKLIIDGIEKGGINSYDFSSNTQSFLIGKGRIFGLAKFKEIKMYDGDELVRDLVPYYKKDINKVGMLDKVQNVFYENQGTGEFLWG